MGLGTGQKDSLLTNRKQKKGGRVHLSFSICKNATSGSSSSQLVCFDKGVALSHASCSLHCSRERPDAVNHREAWPGAQPAQHRALQPVWTLCEFSKATRIRSTKLISSQGGSLEEFRGQGTSTVGLGPLFLSLQTAISSVYLHVTFLLGTEHLCLCSCTLFTQQHSHTDEGSSQMHHSSLGISL